MYELADFRALITREKKTKTFDELEREYGGNRWHFSRLLSDPDFVPSPKVCRVWGVLYEKPAPVCTNQSCEGYGEPHVFDCRTQQVKQKSKPRSRPVRWGWLWDMPQDELRLAMENKYIVK